MQTSVRDTPELGASPGPVSSTRLKWLRLLAFFVVPSLFVGFLAIGLSKRSDTQRLTGKPAPNFELPLLQGGSLSSTDLKRHPVVVNFWASWCKPCREEAPTLQAKWEKYGGEGVRFVGINVQDLEEDARAFVQEFGITFPSVRDTDLKLYTSFGVRGLPETFFIDHTYKFRAVGSGDESGTQGSFKILGAIQPGLLEAQIRHLLELTEARNRS